LSQKNVRWLVNELPKLVEQKLISIDQRRSIEEYYEKEKINRPNIALIAFSVFGAILLAAGIILILAHNWSSLSRPVRTVLSFLPLVVGQAIGFWVILRRRNSIAWCEGISAFIALAIGASIALISQTYHIHGELNTFLLTWVLLALPLPYIFSSTTATVLYLMGISGWAIAAAEAGNAPAHGFWLLFIAIGPMFIIKNWGNLHQKQVAIIGWFLSLSLIAGVSVGNSSVCEGYRVITFISLFLCLYLVGTLTDVGRSLRSNPFHRVGIIGLAVTYLFLSYRHSWDNLSYHAAKMYGHGQTHAIGDWIVCIGLPALAALLLVVAVRRKNWISLGMAIGLLLAFFGFGFTDSAVGRVVFTALFNVYVFAGGVAYMVSGIRSNQGKIVNFGFALVAAVIILRFFDSDFSFVLRGIIFVILGAGFLCANMFIAKRRAA